VADEIFQGHFWDILEDEDNKLIKTKEIIMQKWQVITCSPPQPNKKEEKKVFIFLTK